jgi:uncharacterized protein
MTLQEQAVKHPGDKDHAPLHAGGFDLAAAIEQIAHWLPNQGPIKDFIHHNTLHAVQHMPFHEGVALAGKIFGARSYLPIEDYHKRYRLGRISDPAIDWAVDHCDVPLAQKKLVRESLFEQDHDVHYPPASLTSHGIRNVWLNALALELNTLTHPILFRLLSNFLDQGISQWTMAKKSESFWECIGRLTHNSLVPLHPFNQPGIRRLLLGTPEQAIAACLDDIVGDPSLYEQYLLEMLLAHPGWSGMVHIVEQNPGALLASRKIGLTSLIAVELICEMAFLHIHVGRTFLKVRDCRFPESITLLRNGWPNPVVPLTLKIWQEAMEKSLYDELFLGLARNNPPPSGSQPAQQSAQAVFCLDDRECSIRRNLEEIDPTIETFGAAGFFGIDFLYQGLDDAYPVAQCPAIITPRHLIKERKTSETDTDDKKQDKKRHFHFQSHSILRGWLYTQTIGLGYAIRMAWDVFSPGITMPRIKRLSEVKAHSHLHLLRESEIPTKEGYLLGFSYLEMAEKVAGLLNNIGLNENFAPIVLIVAHGASSVNNPHFAAYDCGACSGKPGAPNARAFAWMANQIPVRRILIEHGIEIPEATHFIAAMHNTTRDEIEYYDEATIPFHAKAQFTAFHQAMEQALQENARERCRWFELGPGTRSAENAHDHVGARASSIFEPRPEYNHSNNLYAVVGRRELTRGLFLDRRAFLHSYEPGKDQSGNILMRILSAVIPVCGGINLEYLFSRIDNSVYGAGTKLPHNVIGLLGVANGVEGDLRTGLPQQMIEVHEPARLLIVVEQTTAIMDKVLVKLGELREWVDNECVRLATCHPESRALSLFTQDGWQAISPTQLADLQVVPHEHVHFRCFADPVVWLFRDFH